MSFLLFLRDKIVPYVFFFSIAVGGIGGIVWIIAQTYFWNTSDVTFIVDEEIISAKIDSKARLIYKDFVFFQDTYPFHITIPFSRVISCTRECIFSDIPAGDAQISFFTETGLQQRESIVVSPDTRGSIDMRVPVRVREIESSVITGDTPLPEATDFPVESFYRNTLQGLSLLYDNGLLFLHDTSTLQRMLVGKQLNVRSAVRGMQEGVYYLTTQQNEVLIFDRYGRQKMELVTHSTLGEKDIIWESREGSITSKVRIDERERVLSGRFFWLVSPDKHYLFDGEKVFEILN